MTMTRQRISGWEVTRCGYTLELVTVGRCPRVLALWQHTRLLWRWESGAITPNRRPTEWQKGTP